MLVLSRKVGEEVVINGNITLKVTDVGGGQVRIGFSAPRDVSIDRAEVHAAKNEFRGGVEAPATGAVEHQPAVNRIRRHLDAKSPRGER